MEIEFIKWMTLTEVAKRLSETSDTELTEMDVLELAAYCRLRISAQFTEPVPARKGIISPSHSAGYSERVIYEKSLMPAGITGVFELWIGGSDRPQINSVGEFQTEMGGLHFRSGVPSELYELMEGDRGRKTLPEGVKWVVKADALQDFENVMK